MTPAELAKIGEALFGPWWQTAMAEALGVNPRTLRFWVAGQRPIWPTLRNDLAALCEERGAALLKLSKELRRAAAA